jgi:hypothetical protein
MAQQISKSAAASLYPHLKSDTRVVFEQRQPGTVMSGILKLQTQER